MFYKSSIKQYYIIKIVTVMIPKMERNSKEAALTIPTPSVGKVKDPNMGKKIN